MRNDSRKIKFKKKSFAPFKVTSASEHTAIGKIRTVSNNIEVWLSDLPLSGHVTLHRNGSRHRLFSGTSSGCQLNVATEHSSKIPTGAGTTPVISCRQINTTVLFVLLLVMVVGFGGLVWFWGWDRFSRGSPSWPKTHCIELPEIYLPLSSKCWD